MRVECHIPKGPQSRYRAVDLASGFICLRIALIPQHRVGEENSEDTSGPHRGYETGFGLVVVEDRGSGDYFAMLSHH